MFVVLGFMLAGIVVGFLFRRWKIRFIHGLILTLIWLLLFLLGLEIGSNQSVVSQFPRLGLQAFLLATGGIVGSVLAAWLLGRAIPKSPKGDFE